MTVPTLLIVASWLVPLAAGWWIGRSETAWARGTNTAIAAGCGMIGSLLFLVGAFPNTNTTTQRWAEQLQGLNFEGTSALLIALASLQLLLVTLALPLRATTPSQCRSGLWVLAGTNGLLSTTHSLMSVLFWTLSLVPLWLDVERLDDRTRRFLRSWLLGIHGVPFILGILGASFIAWTRDVPGAFDVHQLLRDESTSPFVQVATFLVGISVWSRAALFPLHLWLPVTLHRCSPMTATLTSINSVGTFSLVHFFLVPFGESAHGVAPTLLWVGLVSAGYGTLLALGQSDLRRQLGYLIVSTNGFIACGLMAMNPASMSGAMLHDFGTTAAFTGLMVLLSAIHARTGTTAVERLGGLARSAPDLGTGYLALGLAAVAFPGSATFISEDLLMQGILTTNAWLVPLLHLTVGINGITLVWSHQRAFLGRMKSLTNDLFDPPDLSWRERLAAIGLVFLLLAGFLFPPPVIAIREHVLRALRTMESSDEGSRPETGDHAHTHDIGERSPEH